MIFLETIRNQSNILIRKMVYANLHFSAKQLIYRAPRKYEVFVPLPGSFNDHGPSFSQQWPW